MHSIDALVSFCCSMDGSGSFGRSTLFGMPSQDTQTIITHMQLAVTNAQLSPGNHQAQRQAAYWTEVVQRQAASMGLQGTPPFQPAAAAQQQSPAPAPSPAAPSLFGATQGLQGIPNFHYVHEQRMPRILSTIVHGDAFPGMNLSATMCLVSSFCIFKAAGRVPHMDR